MGRNRVRVLVADDHPIYREGLVRSVKERPELEFVGEAADGREALARIRELDPDVAVLDVRMPNLGGVEVLHAIQRDGLRTRVVFLSASAESEVVYRAVAMGAGAYLSKEAGRKEILETVGAVARGDTVVAEETQTDARPLLTPRERQILLLTADGNSAPEVARTLNLSTATVKTHLGSLYAKLGVSDRAAAVAVAMRTGLVE